MLEEEGEGVPHAPSRLTFCPELNLVCTPFLVKVACNSPIGANLIPNAPGTYQPKSKIIPQSVNLRLERNQKQTACSVLTLEEVKVATTVLRSVSCAKTQEARQRRATVTEVNRILAFVKDRWRSKRSEAMTFITIIATCGYTPVWGQDQMVT